MPVMPGRPLSGAPGRGTASQRSTTSLWRGSGALASSSGRSSWECSVAVPSGGSRVAPSDAGAPGVARGSARQPVHAGGRSRNVSRPCRLRTLV